ncbi:MAG: endopeptidase La [Actinobacteria bacterium]|nr:endopeptidase La [Actinomycetota bacterium]
MDDVTTVALPLLPLPDGVVAPQMVVNMVAESEQARRAVDAARAGDGRLVLVPQIDGRYGSIGTIGMVEQDEQSADGTRAVLVRGIERARIGAGHDDARGGLRVAVEPVVSIMGDPARTTELAREYRAVLGEILRRRRARGVAAAVAEITDPGTLADTALYSPDLSVERKVEVLETLDVTSRLDKVLAWARDTLADITVSDDVRKRTGEQIDKSQREAILRQQLAAIRAELGEDDDGDLIAEYEQRIADAAMPDDVAEFAGKELRRMERMGESNPEHGWIRTWLDRILELPWSTRTDDNLDLAAARVVLDADHTYLDDIKDRLIEFLAVRKLRAERELGPETGRGTGAILALVGPPGTGKTSLGESVARALGRRFVRVALGGVRDEAEIRGHRRTYVGAQPGRIARALAEAGTANPVILLDEIDKVAADWRGDPSAALLEVLDPEQNHTFRDHYLEVDLDLSEVLFIATGNVVDTIPGPLLDRMEVVRLDGYSDNEKVAIARNHLLPRQQSRAGLRDDELDLTDHALVAIADGYTREAGVRSLERQLAKLIRKVVTRIATGAASTPVTVDADELTDLLGRPTVHHEQVAERTSVPGVATGLAVTGMGGDVLFIEANRTSGEAGLTITGQLGDVMRESAEIALSYVRANAATLGLADDALDATRIHLHVPAGAIPKDGPSAGITMTTALVSLLRGQPVASDIGMTGEITLQGLVLPIGGVKQKLLAAHRAGLRRVVLPRRNADDLDDVPAHVRDDLDITLADRYDQVLAATPPPADTLPAAA